MVGARCAAHRTALKTTLGEAGREGVFSREPGKTCGTTPATRACRITELRVSGFHAKLRVRTPADVRADAPGRSESCATRDADGETPVTGAKRRS